MLSASNVRFPKWLSSPSDKKSRSGGGTIVTPDTYLFLILTYPVMEPILSETSPSLEEIVSRCGLKETDLERECPQGVRDEIAVKLDDWQMVGRYLGFTLKQLRDIDRENGSQEMCRIALLDIWAKKEGERATYFKLAGVLHLRQRCDLVELLCTRLRSKLTLVPRITGNVASDAPSGDHQQHHVHQHQGGSTSRGIANFTNLHTHAIVKEVLLGGGGGGGGGEGVEECLVHTVYICAYLLYHTFYFMHNHWSDTLRAT